MQAAIPFEDTLQFARQLDEQDPLAEFRAEFTTPLDPQGQPAIYLCANSLGPQPKQALAAVEQVLEQWRTLAVRGHFEGPRPWIPYPEAILPLMAEVLGAGADEVIPMGSLSENIYLLLSAFYQPQGQRRKILALGGGFPSDRYILHSFLQLQGEDPSQSLILLGPPSGSRLIPDERILQAIDQHGPELALVFFPAVHFATGQAFDLPAITRRAHDYQARVGFDLAHAAGNIPLKLHDWQVDFAAWCGYKYLSSGPGNGGGIYLHRQHASNPDFLHPAGWWGNDPGLRFEMRETFEPHLTARRLQLSNPSVLSLAPLLASLQVFYRAGMERIFTKSRQQTAYLEYLLENHTNGGFEIVTPRSPHARGNQLSLAIQADAEQVAGRLLEHGVVIDERPPDIIRVAAFPLYNTFEELWRFTQIFSQVLADQ